MCEYSHTVLRSDVDAAHKFIAYASLPSQDVETCMGCLQDKKEMLLSVQVLAHKAATCHTWWGIQLDIIVLRFLQSVTHELALKTHSTPAKTEVCALVSSGNSGTGKAEHAWMIPHLWYSSPIQIWVHVRKVTSVCMRSCHSGIWMRACACTRVYVCILWW